MFAEVSLPISSFQNFTYSIPENLKNSLLVGSRVKVPFGARKVSGIIVSLIDESSFAGNLKSIIDVDDNTPVLSNELWKLVNWISHYYVTPIGLAYNTVLPFSLLSNHNPRKAWFVRYVARHKNNKKNTYEKLSSKQNSIFEAIRQAPLEYIKVSRFKGISSNPISICKALEKKGLVELEKRNQDKAIEETSFKSLKKNILYNKEQLIVIKSLKTAIKSGVYSSNLLHGVTGSGKTEIFIEIIKTVKKLGKCSIVLIPEISLTSQIAGRFKQVFGDDMALWHSQLSKSQRAKTWRDINDGTCKIVIGARSAIFSPVKNLGLIIVDEEHDSSYKQDSPSPRYHARDVAIMRSKIEKCTVVLSSATPSLETFYNYKLKKYNYLTLSKRYGDALYPKVRVVDLIDESKESGKFNIIISGLLQEKIEKRLSDNEQVLLIQNRRGFSPTVKCSDCGTVVMCLACKTPLTFHKYDNNFKCHICG
ncbi:MAG: primosomal protein N', partial [bacterium]